MGGEPKRRKAKAKAKWRAKNKAKAKVKNKWSERDKERAVAKAKATADRIKAKADAKAKTKANKMAKARAKRKKKAGLSIKEVKLCPKCLKRGQNSSHHIYPKRHFGNGSVNRDIIRLCRDCHNDLELIIPFEKQPKEVYIDILGLFLTMDVRLIIDSIGGISQG